MSSSKRENRKHPLKPEPAKRKVVDAVTLDANGWPEGYVESFAGISEDFERPPQGELEVRETFDCKPIAR